MSEPSIRTVLVNSEQPTELQALYAIRQILSEWELSQSEALRVVRYIGEWVEGGREGSSK